MDFPLPDATPNFAAMPGTNDPLHRTITIYEPGIFHNASECHIVSEGVQIFPDLHATSQAQILLDLHGTAQAELENHGFIYKITYQLLPTTKPNS